MYAAPIATLVLFAAVPAAPIDRVVVYADRAEVTRVATGRCDASGVAAIDLPPLPTAVDERTLRAEALGRARAIGTSSRLVPAEDGRVRDDRVQAVEEELKTTRRALRTAADEATTLAERTRNGGGYGEYLLAILAEDVRNPKPATGTWKEALDRLRNEATTAAARQAELARVQRKLERDIGRLERRLESYGGAQVPEVRAARVAVACEGENEAKVRVSYVIPGATWRPEYDVRFEPTAKKAKVGPGKVELTVAAVVQQATGEDWSGVELVLSTAKPRLGAEAPEPAPLYVGGSKIGSAKVLVEATERREGLAGGGPGGSTGPRSAALADRGRSFTLTLPRRVTVASDGRPYWMPVDVVAGKAEVKLVAVPKLIGHVYQVVKLENPAAYPLLAGVAHAYRSDSYVGDQDLVYRAPGEPFEVSLGPDDELRVQRKEVEGVDKGPGMLSSTRRLERAYRITLESSAGAKVAVELRENLPVSKVEDVRVELEAGRTTPGYTLDAERGFLRWTVELAPGGKRSTDFGYTVKLPDDWAVGG